MPFNNIHIIFNPASSGGKTGEQRNKILSAVEFYFGKNYSLWITGKPDDAVLLTWKALKEGCDLIIAAGGDGTIQQIVNGLLYNKNDRSKSCSLGILNCGTGQGFAQSLCLPKTINEQLLVIKNGFKKKIDAGRISFNCEGKRKIKYFINEFQAGIGGAVVRNVNQNLKRQAGVFAFGLGTLSAVFNYPNHKMSMVIDDSLELSGEYTGIVIANGKRTGGGMNLTPLSNLCDGYLDLLLMHRQSAFQRLLNFPKIYSGKHINSGMFSYHFIRKVKLLSNEKVPMEADGEILDSLPCEIEAVPSAINVCVPQNGELK